MPCTAKTTNSTVDPTNLHIQVLQNQKIPTPQQVSTPHDMAPACPPSEARCVKPWPAAEPLEGWEEHMFGYRDRRMLLTPHTSLASTPSPLPPKENCICKEDAEMSTPEKSSGRSEVEVEVEGDEGVLVTVGVMADDGDDNNSLLSSSSPPPFQPSDSSDVEDELLSVHKSNWTSGMGKALDDICDFTTKVKKEAEELRFGVKPSHMKLNEANLFHSCIGLHKQNQMVCLRSSLAKRDTINDIITKEYKSLIQDILKDDTVARREKLKHVYEWSENSSTVPTSKSAKSIATRVQNVKMQFSGLLHGKIEIAGVVIYVGQDPAGCQTSGIFGGSDIVRNFINQLMSMHKWMSTLLYSSKIPQGWGWSRGWVTWHEFCQRELILHGNCNVTLMQGIEVGNPQKIVWQCILEFMTKIYLIILNWPHGVSPPGPRFEYEKLKGDPLRKLVVPYLCQKLGTMYESDSLDGVLEIEIGPWNQDVIKMSESPNLKGEIPLVKAADGVVLHKVSDDLLWQMKAHEGEDTRHEELVDPPQQHQLPFPSCKLHTLRIRKCLKGMLALFREATEYGTLNCNLQIMMRATTERGTHNARKRTLLIRPITWLHDYNDPGPSNEPYNVMQFLPVKMSDLTSLHPINSITACHPALTLMFTMMPTPQNWGNRGNILQYKDGILGDYVEEDY
ncbi:hypothetical protein BKA83DRAFT_4125587 [Pisolithus microcarpus]|nr:hypothetical protein BKA83DRAFT_4125587 [Pisolithus microcarpus]